MFFKKLKYNANKPDLGKKIEYIDKTADTHNLVTNTAFNTKTVEVENKKQIPDILLKFPILRDYLVILLIIKTMRNLKRNS